MLVKTVPAQVKAITDADPEGVFEAIVSVFGNVDSYGDVVMPGAFTETLAEWKASGDPIPVLFAHNSYDPDFNIGAVLEAEERPEGLWVKAQLDIDADTGKARQVHRLLKGRRVKQFSFAYDVLDAAWGKSEELGEYYELRKLKLYEVGPCLIGANQQTQLIGAKSDDTAIHGAARALTVLATEVKAGRVLSSANETRIRTAVGELTSVLDALPSSDDEAGKTSTTDSSKATADEPAKDEEPAGAKSEEPMRRSPASELAVLALDIELGA